LTVFNDLSYCLDMANETKRTLTEAEIALLDATFSPRLPLRFKVIADPVERLKAALRPGQKLKK
jgi:hypothetical protein